MDVAICVSCVPCHETLMLGWDPATFLIADPLSGQSAVECEAAEGALLYGYWPGGYEAKPPPLTAGAWAALASMAGEFAATHLAHADSAGLLICRAPPGVDPGLPPALVYPASTVAAPAHTVPDENTVRGLRMDERLALASKLGPVGLQIPGMTAEASVRTRAAVGGALLLTGWLPPDLDLDERLLAWTVDGDLGPLAEEVLALRIVLGTGNLEQRRQRLRQLAEAAFARVALGSSKRRATPYDVAGALDRLQVQAVEWGTRAGRLDDACELARRLAVPPVHLPVLREALASCILNATLDAETRLRRAWCARELFPGLLHELRVDRGLAQGPLPEPEAWAALDERGRTLTGLVTEPAAIARGLAATELPRLLTTLDLVNALAWTAPEEAVIFEPAVRALCRDARIQPGTIPVRLCCRARDVHVRLFAALRGHGAWESLAEVIDAMLLAGLGGSLGSHFRALKANGLAAERAGALLVRHVADRSCLPKVRIQAREALAALAAEAAAERHNEPRPSPEGQAAARQADELLLAALRDPAEPDELKRAIRAALTRWMPERIPMLQGNAIPRTPVPSISAFPGGPPVAEIDQNELFELLREPQAELGRVLGAIALVAQFARWAPGAPAKLEPLLRGRIADPRRFTDRGRELVVAIEAQRAHRDVWSLLPAGERPGAAVLLESLLQVAATQGAVGVGEEDRAEALMRTIAVGLSPADIDAAAVRLLAVVADRANMAWTRLHAFQVLTVLPPGHDGRANNALFAALADPSEDSLLRAEAHAILAPRLPRPVHELQAKGRLPRPALPPVEALYRYLVWFERDTAGEWVLTSDARRIADMTWPDDLLACLRDPAQNPACACAAAALAPRLAWRLPDLAGPLVVALRGCLGRGIQRQAVADGRAVVFQLDELCTAALHTLRA